MSGERAARLARLSRALEARREIETARGLGLEREIAETARRRDETIEFSVVQGGPDFAAALARRLARLQAQAAALARDREASLARARADRRLSRAAAGLAARLAQEEARRAESRALEEMLDQRLGARVGASLRSASAPSLAARIREEPS